MFKLLDKFASYRPIFDVVLLVFFWLTLAVATWVKDYENMAIASWWIILLELVQVNDNLKALKEKE
jgi:hypothetical protein